MNLAKQAQVNVIEIHKESVLLLAANISPSISAPKYTSGICLLVSKRKFKTIKVQ